MSQGELLDFIPEFRPRTRVSIGLRRKFQNISNRLLVTRVVFCHGPGVRIARHLGL